MAYNNWQEALADLASNPEEHFFTKEDQELISSWQSLQNFNQYVKFQEWFANLDSCKIQQFLVIRKIGSQLITNSTNRFNAINRSQEAYMNWCGVQVTALASIVGQFSITPTVDVKQAVISLILQTQLITQITRLGTQTVLLEEELAKNPFCLECCPEEL